MITSTRNIYLDNQGLDLAKTIELIGKEIVKRSSEIAGNPAEMESIYISVSISPDERPELTWEKTVSPDFSAAVKKLSAPPLTIDDPEYGE